MGKFIDFDEVRTKYSILDVCKRLLGAQLHDEGGNKHRGPCPFCEDKRSFRVTTDAGSHGQGMAGCFKCGPKGDSIAVVAKKFGLKANEAAALILDRMGGNTVPAVEQVSTGSTPGTSNSTVPADKAEKLKKVAARLQHEHEEVQALGLTPEQAHGMGIGYVPSGILGAGVLFPLFENGVHVDFCCYSPDEGLRFPTHIVPKLKLVKAS